MRGYESKSRPRRKGSPIGKKLRLQNETVVPLVFGFDR
jgi:hypothetical protein